MTHNRITSNYLTRTEKAKIIGERAEQINRGAHILVDLNEEDIDPIKIAEKELEEGKLHMVIRRFLPNGKYEDWTADELLQLR